MDLKVNRNKVFGIHEDPRALLTKLQPKHTWPLIKVINQMLAWVTGHPPLAISHVLHYKFSKGHYKLCTLWLPKGM